MYLPVTFINDGIVDWENVQKAGFDQNWLDKQLYQQRIEHYEDIFFI